MQKPIDKGIINKNNETLVQVISPFVIVPQRKLFMLNILSNTWNIGVALGELASSMFLVFFVMSLTSFFKNQSKNKDKISISKISQSALYSLSGLAAIFIGKAVGNIFTSSGDLNGDYGLGLTTPLFAILTCFDFLKFNALPMIISFQLIGAILGTGLYLLYGFAINQNRNESNAILDGLILNEVNYKTVSITETLSQSMLAIVVILIPTIGGEIIGANTFTNSFVLIAALFVILAVFSRVNFFILSPFINLSSLIIGHFYKVTNKKHWFNFSLQLGIHICVALSIGGIDVAIRHR